MNASLSPPILSTQSRWSDALSHSFPNFEDYPKRYLSTEEQELVLWLQTFKVRDYYTLVSAEQLATKIKELWSWLLKDISVKSVAKHLVKGKEKSSNRSYANKEYQVGVRKYGLWLFRKGLLRAYPVPARQAKQKYMYSYPLEKYQLIQRNYRSKFPPHNYFASMCTKALQEGVGSGVLRKVNPRKYVVPHWDDSGRYIADNCYWMNFHGQEEYLWQEVHTGSEQYDQTVFLKRLLTMEEYLSRKGTGYYVVFVPFVRDKQKAMQAIEKYNEMNKITGRTLELQRSFIEPYSAINLFKERIGVYSHQKK